MRRKSCYTLISIALAILLIFGVAQYVWGKNMSEDLYGQIDYLKLHFPTKYYPEITLSQVLGGTIGITIYTVPAGHALYVDVVRLSCYAEPLMGALFYQGSLGFTKLDGTMVTLLHSQLLPLAGAADHSEMSMPIPLTLKLEAGWTIWADVDNVDSDSFIHGVLLPA